MDFSYTAEEKLKITSGAEASLIVVGWLAVVAILFMSVM